MTAKQSTLALPGAGIPRLEKTIGRLMLANLRRRSPAAWAAKFQQERAKLRQLVEGLDETSGARRVLIPRPPGLEDCSRDWSIWMTFDHLRIVNLGIAGIITDLSTLQDHGAVVRIEDVKPTPEAGPGSLDEHEAACEALLAAAAAAWAAGAAARGGRTHPHPWFGPIDAATWFCLAATHLGLHREQIHRILNRM